MDEYHYIYITTKMAKRYSIMRIEVVTKHALIISFCNATPFVAFTAAEPMLTS